MRSASLFDCVVATLPTAGREASARTRPATDGKARHYLACCLLVILPLSLLSCTTSADPGDSVDADDGHGATALGAVSSAHPLATAAGIEILEEGGNAFDAAVAVASVLTVVEPMNSNLIGGYGSLIVHVGETGETRYLDNNGRFPALTDSDVFRAAEDRSQIVRTAQAISTPLNLQGFEKLWRELGSLEWARLLNDATRHAEEGVAVSAPLAGSIDRAWEHFSDYSRSFYGADGRPLAEGELLIQKDLAASLRAVASDGSDALRGGALGQAIDAEMKRRGGFLRLSDLEEQDAEWLDPISIDYRGVEVVTAGAPSNSFASLVCLGLMSRFDNAASGHNSATTLHRFAEATKHAFWARLAYAGGPEVNPPPFDRLLSEAYWQEQADLIGSAASGFEPPAISVEEGASTTHFVVADAEGNVVSATITLGQGFGSAVMAEGIGVWLNNSLAFSTYEPKGNPMDAIPGARKHSSKTPTLLLKDGKPWIAIGTPGGHTIPQTTPQMVMNLVDFELDLQTAIDAPRVSFAEPDRLLVEPGLSAEVVAALEQLGHQTEESGPGLAHALMIESTSSGLQFEVAADSRGVGTGEVATKPE